MGGQSQSRTDTAIRRQGLTCQSRTDTAIRRQGLTIAEAPHRYHYDEYGSLSCDMIECMIIGAFGTRPDEMKAVAKKSSRPDGNYLRGVRQDIETVQELIRKDHHKQLTYSCVDFPLEGGLRPKREYLDKINKLLMESKAPGVLIWYSGHGQENTGNWCFKDDVITFDEIWELYQTCFRGRLLYIVSDCCYSGQWVHRLAEKLDWMGVPACGHKAKEKGILLKIVASCQADQVAYDTCFSEKGILYDDEKQCINFRIKVLRPGQTSCYLDTTKVRCFRSPEESCRFCDLPAGLQWSWKDLLNNDERRSIMNRVHTVTGTDLGRPAWREALIRKDLEEEFKAKTTGTMTFNIADYGHVLYSGWGEDTPQEIKKKIDNYGPRW